jgi:hypothetical protein
MPASQYKSGGRDDVTDLPDNLWHIQRLGDGQLKDSSYSLKVFNSTFDLSPLNPRGAERRVILQVSFASRDCATELTVKNFSYSVLTRSNSLNRISSSI